MIKNADGSRALRQRTFVNQVGKCPSCKVPRVCRGITGGFRSNVTTEMLRTELDPESAQHRTQQAEEMARLAEQKDEDKELLAALEEGDKLEEELAAALEEEPPEAAKPWEPAAKRAKILGDKCPRCEAGQTKKRHLRPDGKCPDCERTLAGERSAAQRESRNAAKRAQNAEAAAKGLTAAGKSRIRPQRCEGGCDETKLVNGVCPECKCGRKR